MFANWVLKNPHLTKVLLHYTPYFNFIILFFNISLLLLLLFFITPEILHYKKHYYIKKKKSFLFSQLMNINSSSWRSYCSSMACFRSNGEFGAGSFLQILLKFGCFQPNVNSTVSAIRAFLSGWIFGRKQQKMGRRQQKWETSASPNHWKPVVDEQ